MIALAKVILARHVYTYTGYNESFSPFQNCILKHVGLKELYSANFLTSLENTYLRTAVRDSYIDFCLFVLSKKSIDRDTSSSWCFLDTYSTNAKERDRN